MAKILTTTTTTYLLIAAAAYLAALPPITAQSSEAGPTTPALIVVAAAPPPPDCSTYLANSSDCLNFVENGSNLKRPEPACCPELANLLSTKPICLCELISNSTQFGLSIDTDRALRLPSLCNIDNPPAGTCEDFDNAGPTILLPSNQHLLIAIGVALALFTSIV